VGHKTHYTHVALWRRAGGLSGRRRLRRGGRRVVDRAARRRLGSEDLVASEHALVGRQRLAHRRALLDLGAGDHARRLLHARAEARDIAPVARGIGLACATRFEIAASGLGRRDKRNGNYKHTTTTIIIKI
jgi:hypothetical protein